MLSIQQGLRAEGFEVSMVKLCRWFGVARRTVYYRPTKAPPTVKPALADPIKALIEEEPSFGYRTVAGLLGMNKNTVQRIFQLKGWQVRKRAVGRRPRIQFIVTTHDPLCLRGIVDGEVVVMRRNSEGDVISLSDLPPVTGMRIEQLLTSEHFGLGSTDDPEVAELWESYYRLMALHRPSAEQTERLTRVRARLDELEQFGTTERERLLLTSAADYIAQRRETGDAVAPTSKEMTAKLSELWGRYLPGST